MTHDRLRGAAGSTSQAHKPMLSSEDFAEAQAHMEKMEAREERKGRRTVPQATHAAALEEDIVAERVRELPSSAGRAEPTLQAQGPRVAARASTNARELSAAPPTSASGGRLKWVVLVAGAAVAITIGLVVAPAKTKEPAKGATSSGSANTPSAPVTALTSAPTSPSTTASSTATPSSTAVTSGPSPSSPTLSTPPPNPPIHETSSSGGSTSGGLNPNPTKTAAPVPSTPPASNSSTGVGAVWK